MNTPTPRSADFQSAVSRISNPPSVRSEQDPVGWVCAADSKSAIQQIENLRYRPEPHANETSATTRHFEDWHAFIPSPKFPALSATLKPALIHSAFAGALSLLLTACAVGPNYKKPEVANLTPADWRWKTAEPRDEIPKGEWWAVFNDPVLARLEAQAVAENQNLRAVVARVDQARAAARLSRSYLFPEMGLEPSLNRQRTSGHLPTPIPVKVPPATFDTFSLPLDLSYEVDLWGRVRRSFEAARAQARPARPIIRTRC